MCPEKKRDYIHSGKPRDDLILKYTPLIQYIANRLAIRLPPHIDIHDIINSGVIGLMDAIDKFDESKGVKFNTYAEIRIKGAMLDNLRSLDWVPRSIRKMSTQLENTYAALEKKHNRPATDEEVAEALDMDLEKFYGVLAKASGVSLLSLEMISQYNDSRLKLMDCLPESEECNPFNVFKTTEIKDTVADAIELLPQKEKQVVLLYYYEELTMKEISRAMKLTESRVSQIHTKAVLRLRGKLRMAL